ncbi:MAG: hypothetical protein JWR30_1732 [Conexibacter sp.]|nr:hypothetical protein [Conexibacter sp.]
MNTTTHPTHPERYFAPQARIFSPERYFAPQARTSSTTDPARMAGPVPSAGRPEVRRP